MTEQQRLLTVQDLADRLRVSERGVRHLATRGEIPPGLLIGGVRRWDWSEVLKYLERHATRKRRKGRGVRRS